MNLTKLTRSLALFLWAANLFPLNAAEKATTPSAKVEAALARMTANDLLRHTTVLSSDAFEGRAPGSPGEERTVAYMIEQFTKLGLKPGNPDGTYIQRVPLVGIISEPTISVTAGDKPFELRPLQDCVVWSRRLAPTVTVENSDVVFVGYGIVAPEYGWDDYKDVDVRGKTIVMLINDPPIPDPADPAKLDERMFRGKAMTYYGRWTYKFEIATAKGAAAAIIVHETGPAGYPWEVVVGSNSRENMDLQSADGNTNRVAIEGWITTDAARKFCKAGGQDYDSLKQRALRRDFRPVALNAKASFSVQHVLREIAWERGRKGGRY